MIRKIREIPRRDVVLLVLFMVLNVADAWITLHAKHNVPGMYEVNPLMRWALGHGDTFFIAFKMVLAAICSVVAIFLDFGAKWNRVLLIGSAMLALVVIWNVVLYALHTAGM